MDTQCNIVSMMLCKPPMVINCRAVVSASDSVWEPIEHLPKDIDGITDDLGNKNPSYPGTVFLTSLAAVEYLQQHNILICIRGVRVCDQTYTNCPLNIRVENLVVEPVFMGWDIVRGNGWVSASCDGCFPIHLNGNAIHDESASVLNKYSLFENLTDCLHYCGQSNREVPQWAPWYPVAVYCDSVSKNKIDQLINLSIEKGEG